MIVTEKQLDETDKKILHGVLNGKTVKEIGYNIGISPHTVAIRIREMKKWYKCDSLIQLVTKVKFQ